MRSIVSKIFILSFFVIFVSGCATISPSGNIAALNGFEKSYIKTGRFVLTSYSRIKHAGAPVNIYIEGDGVSWVSRARLSDDPTPLEDLILELAVLDPAENVAYLARPGQYSASGIPECDPSYWSGKRFSEEVIESMNEAIGKLIGKAGASEVNLIGYSGGAAVAVLIAARRTDVISLRTIAGNLDTDAVNRYNHVTPFKDSLNPIEEAEKIKDIPQRHFIGSNDRIIPYSIAESFVEAEGGKRGECITIVEGATHTTGWREHWKELLLMPTKACSKQA